MLKYPNISPEIFRIGPIALRWYGLMYAVSFYTLITVMRRESQKKFLPLSEQMVERLFLLLVVFILLFARIFYVVFYSPDILNQGIVETLAIWHGGLSFHGGLAGIGLACWIISRQARVKWVSIVDTGVLVGPLAIFLGRIGNFMNAELYGRVTDVPWGMVFPNGGPLPRHPSQLYESFLEGFVLLALLWFLKPRVRRHGVLTGVFLVGYATARIVCEFFREPDVQLGFIWGPFTMGQLLTLGILIPGAWLLVRSLKHGPEIAGSRVGAKA